VPWCAMVCHGVSWWAMVCCVVCHGVPWCAACCVLPVPLVSRKGDFF
jgi:hypothetical protein